MNGLAIKTDLPSAPSVKPPTGIDREKLEKRFWAKVDKNGPNGCWVWLAATSNGYGIFWIGKGHKERSHRFAYKFLRDCIPEGLEIDHLCRNHACVNPDHLEAVPHEENIHRGLGGINMARRTHCPYGHMYNLLNTRFFRGKRQCRVCESRRDRASKQRRRAVKVLELAGVLEAADAR